MKKKITYIMLCVFCFLYSYAEYPHSDNGARVKKLALDLTTLKEKTDELKNVLQQLGNPEAKQTNQVIALIESEQKLGFKPEVIADSAMLTVESDEEAKAAVESAQELYDELSAETDAELSPLELNILYANDPRVDIQGG